MRRRIRRAVLAITAVAIVAIAGGVTYAVAEIGGGGVINGCYKSPPRDDDDDDAQGVKSASRDDDDHGRGSGQLRVIDPATDSCRRNETPISWNQAGTPGPKGDPGPQGPGWPGSPKARLAPLARQARQALRARLSWPPDWSRPAVSFRLASHRADSQRSRIPAPANTGWSSRVSGPAVRSRSSIPQFPISSM
jgi:hypothetical protein